jgi:hypothetical protein
VHPSITDPNRFSFNGRSDAFRDSHGARHPDERQQNRKFFPSISSDNTVFARSQS